MRSIIGYKNILHVSFIIRFSNLIVKIELISFDYVFLAASLTD